MKLSAVLLSLGILLAQPQPLLAQEANNSNLTIIPDAEVWRDVLYQERNFQEIEAQIASLLEEIPNELASGYLSRIYFVLTEIQSDATVEQMKDVLDAWKAASPESHVPRLVAGGFVINYAWQIRTGKWAKDVPEEAWPLFLEQLAYAQKLLLEAREMNPKDPNAAANLVTVAMGLRLEKEEMERYFQSAIAADPAHLQARMNKLLFLKPKWHGSLQEMYAFARATQKQAEEYPILGVVLHEAHRETQNILRRADKKLTFFNNPDVWEEIQENYERILARYPNYLRTRFNYAYYAYRSYQDAATVKQFEAIGNRWVANTLWDDLETYNASRGRVYRNLANGAMKQKNYPEAEKHFLKVVEADPSNGDAWLQLSWINGEFIRDMNKTKKYATQALTCELNPNQEATARNYIQMAERMGAQ